MAEWKCTKCGYIMEPKKETHSSKSSEVTTKRLEVRYINEVPCLKCGKLMRETSARLYKGLCVECRKPKPKEVIKIFGTSYESTMTLDDFSKRHIASNNWEPSKYKRIE